MSALTELEIMEILKQSDLSSPNPLREEVRALCSMALSSLQPQSGELREALDALEDMVDQFAYSELSDGTGAFCAGGLSTLERAIPMLKKHGRLADIGIKGKRWYRWTTEAERAALHPLKG